jgi:hypothetical protein
MKRTGTLFTVALAIGAALVAGGATAEPTQITACQTLSASGSYVLANNLNPSADCLVIDAESVTIDLAGFSIVGAHTGAGIRTARELRDTVVRNGSIFGFESGISLVGGSSIVEQVRVGGNSGNGIFASGLVRNSTVYDNAGFGITAVGVVIGNTATSNGSCCAGILGGGIVSGNDARANHGEGIIASGTVTGNSAVANAGNGIRAFNPDQGLTVSNNSSGSNGGAGIVVACPAAVIGNAANANAGGNLVLQGAGCISINNSSP